jgi:hypothetical protein
MFRAQIAPEEDSSLSNSNEVKRGGALKNGAFSVRSH